MFLSSARVLFSLVALAGICREGLAGDPGQPAPTLLRISREVVGNMQNQSFDVEQPVNDLVLGTKIKGTSKTTAKCSVEACKADTSNGLQIVVTGVSITTSEGRNGPAIIHSTTTTEFTAHAPLKFDPEAGLNVDEVEVVAESKTTTDDIQSTQKGIAGTFVKKLAAKKIEESREEARAIARDLAIKRIRKAIDKELRARIEQLNQSYAQLLPALKAVHKEGEALRLIADDGNLLVHVGNHPNVRTDQLPKLSQKADLIVPTAALDAKSSGALAKVTQAMTVSVSTQARVQPAAPRLPQLVRQQGWLIVRASDPTLIAE